MELIRTETLDSGIHVLTFDRPDSSANIFDMAALTELDVKIADLAHRATGVLFISAKPSIFIAGADLHALESLSGAALLDFISMGQQVMNRIAALPCPTVAAIHGACVGGGYELCLACSRRIATDARATKIGLPETQLGILPAWGGSTRLPRLIGVPAALDIILGGKTLPAKAALKRGMIDDIAPRETLRDASLKWLAHPTRAKHRWHAVDLVTAAVAAPIARKRMLEKSRGLYPALPKALEVVTLGAKESIESSLHREREAVIELASTSECRNLIRLHHLQDRARKLRMPDDDAAAAAAPITRVGVIGAGLMGASIAQWLSSRGLRVLLRDIDPERVADGMRRVSGLYRDAVKRRLLTATEARDGLDRISPVTGETPLESIDLVIEAAVEKMDLKKRIFTRLDETVPSRVLLATNTSALSITELAAATRQPERVVGIHFFNPVHRMSLVEVITGQATAPDLAASALRFVQAIGKMPVLVRDSAGFLVNRILLPYMVEAGDLFAQGGAVEEIDAAMLAFGMPMGPLRLIDEVGLDVALDVAATLAAAFPGHMHLPAVLDRMLADQLLGKKSGTGFYIHTRGKTVPNPAAAKYRDATAGPALDRAAMQRRMALLMVNEAARCIAEKVVADPADVDFGMIMGAGFAPFRGGPLRYADSLGAASVVAALREEAARSGPHFTPCDLLQEMSETNRRFYDNP